MLSVIVLEGGEELNNEDLHDNEVTIFEWTHDELRRVISEHVGDDWTCGESLTIINRNLAQATKCDVEGGMMYVVRC
jgi:hypothetical protein